MAENLTLTQVIASTPQRIYEAWLNADEHSKMTANAAAFEGDKFTTFNGYIRGQFLETKPFERIVQRWRTTDFPENAGDSDVVISLTETAGGTAVTLEQTNIPDGQAGGYEAGWREFYFAPMKSYFEGSGEKVRRASDAIEGAIEQFVEQSSAQFAKAVSSIEQASKRAQQETEQIITTAKKSAQTAGKKAQKQAATAVKKVSTLGKKVTAALKKSKPAKGAARAAKASKKSLAKAKNAMKKLAPAAKKPSAKKAKKTAPQKKSKR